MSERLLAAMAARAEIDPAQLEALPRHLLDVACRIRTGETLHRDDELVDQAAHALRAALAQQAPAVAGPTDWPDAIYDALARKHTRDFFGSQVLDYKGFAREVRVLSTAQPAAEPTAEQVALLDPWMRSEAARELLRKVLAAAPQPPQAQPLTEAVIKAEGDRLFAADREWKNPDQWFARGVRFAERAHGIGGT